MFRSSPGPWDRGSRGAPRDTHRHIAPHEDANTASFYWFWGKARSVTTCFPLGNSHFCSSLFTPSRPQKEDGLCVEFKASRQVLSGTESITSSNTLTSTQLRSAASAPAHMESSTPSAVAYPVQDAVPTAHFAEPMRPVHVESMRVCRRCGCQFTPPPNSRGSAKEHRCQECLGMTAFANDMAMSCSVQ